MSNRLSQVNKNQWDPLHSQQHLIMTVMVGQPQYGRTSSTDYHLKQTQMLLNQIGKTTAIQSSIEQNDIG